MISRLKKETFLKVNKYKYFSDEKYYINYPTNLSQNKSHLEEITWIPSRLWIFGSYK